jgi:hypothetical protein
MIPCICCGHKKGIKTKFYAFIADIAAYMMKATTDF